MVNGSPVPSPFRDPAFAASSPAPETLGASPGATTGFPAPHDPGTGPATARGAIAEAFRAGDLLLGGALGGVAVAVLDFMGTRSVSDPGAGPFSAPLAALAASHGIVVGFALTAPVALAAKVFGLRRPGGRRLSAFHPTNLLVVLVLGAGLGSLNAETILRAARPDIAAGFAAALLVLVGVVLAALPLALRVLATPAARRPVGSLAAALVFSAAAATLHRLDATLLPRLYPRQHLQLALATFAASGLAAFLVLRPLRFRRAALLAVLLATAAVAVLLSTRRSDAAAPARATLATRAVTLGRIFPTLDRELGALLDAPPPPVADVSGVFARRQRDAEKAKTLGPKLDALVPRRRAMNLLVVSFDALRADRLSCLGYRTRTGQKTTPTLDELAARSLHFRRTWSAYPTSSWSYSSFFTGLVPHASPAALAQRDPNALPPEDLAIAGLLRGAGFATAAVSAFNRETLARRPVFGHLRDGFASFNPDENIEAVPAPVVTERAIKELERLRGSRFFLWVHYLDPHDPYTRHPDFDFGPTDSDRYDSEVAATDASAADLLAALRRLALDEETIVVVMSDHGEAFGEHQSRYHASTVYDEQIRVPFLIAIPGVAGRAIEATTSLLDFVPTLTTLLDVDDRRTRHGRDLWPEVLGLAEHAGIAYARVDPDTSFLGGGRAAIVRANSKLIKDLASGVEEIYDLASDPGETRNLIGDPPADAPLLRGLLHTIEELRPPGVTEAPAADALDLLRSALDVLPTIRSPRELDAYLLGIADHVADPAGGLARGLRGRLDQGMRTRLLSALQTSVDAQRPAAVLAATRILEPLDDPEQLPWLRTLSPEFLAPALEVAILRAHRGDATVKAELASRYASSDSPERHRLGGALLALGVLPPDTSPIVAALEAPWPKANAGVLAGFGRTAPETLIELAEQYLSAPMWQLFAPLRRAVVPGIAGLSPSKEKVRLLARLAYDFDPETATAARAVLERDLRPVPGATEAYGEAVASAYRALLHADVETSAAAFGRALELAPNAGDLALRLARLLQHLGDLAGARRVLETASRSSRADEAARRLRHLVTPETWLAEAPRAELTAVSKPAIASCDGVATITVTLVNRNRHAWPGDRIGLWCILRPEWLDAEGRPVEVRGQAERSLGANDVAPGETATMALAVLAPSKPGRYRLALRLIFQACRRPDLPAPDALLLVPEIEVGKNLRADIGLGQ